MAEEPVDQPQNVERSNEQRRGTDAALATSVPDDNHLLMQMIRLFLGRHDEGGRRGLIGILGSLLAGVITLVWVGAKWGVPAILAGSQLILQLHGDNVKEHDADRATAQEQLKATQEVSDGIDQLGAKIDAQGAKLTQLSSDVEALKQHQVAADQRLGRLSAVQAEQAKAFQTRKP